MGIECIVLLSGIHGQVSAVMPEWSRSDPSS